MVKVRVPVSTYRLQFNGQFVFKDAQSIVSYLHKLGITDLYASPILKPRRGSSHGYDVVDPTRLNPELGEERDFDALVRGLESHDMGLLLDIVPNHMAASSENRWWMHVLEQGRASPYAPFFDIEWSPACSLLDGKLLLPILGRPYGEALEHGELTLKLEDDGVFVRYYESTLPLNASACASIVAHRLDVLEGQPEFQRLVDAIQAIENLQETTSTTHALKEGLFQVVNSSPLVREHVSRTIAAINGNKGDPGSFDFLDNLLSRQSYRLAFWKSASEEINYRRFFDISDLVALRVEDPRVFASAHSFVLRLIEEGKVTGLRLDHIDGLYGPVEYLERLDSRVMSGSGDGSGDRFYVVAEKVLVGDEALPEDWPVSGTTGYDFLNALNALFVDEEGLTELKSSYARFVGSDASFSQIARANKRRVMSDLFSSEIGSLSYRIASLAAHDRYACDVSRTQLTEALIEITACLPVYRTYIRSERVSESDRVVLEETVELARRRELELEDRAVDFIRRVLLLDYPARMEAEGRDEWLDFVMRWQQFTGPVMAKGVEDTALYNYNCLISLNDVGAEPGEDKLGTETFHKSNMVRSSRWPHTMNTTSTHDTKRSEDARARINILSEMPEEWEKRVLKWSRWNQDKKISVRGSLLPDTNTEWLIYQTMIGAWPLAADEVPQFKERLKAYVEKAAREAKVLTSWLSPDEENESALAAFIDSIMEPSSQNKFLRDFQEFQERVAFYGAINSLSQVLLKATSPGIPDFYQGTELWDFSMVDPDNRRPVDFHKRNEVLDSLIESEKSDSSSLVRGLLESWRDGRIKLFMTYKALSARKNSKELFSQGEYTPLRVSGPMERYVCAFARHLNGSWAISVAPRMTTELCEEGTFPLGSHPWGNDALVLPQGAPKIWLNVFTKEKLEVNSADGKLALSDVFSTLPAALFINGS